MPKTPVVPKSDTVRPRTGPTLPPPGPPDRPPAPAGSQARGKIQNFLHFSLFFLQEQSLDRPRRDPAEPPFGPGEGSRGSRTVGIAAKAGSRRGNTRNTSGSEIGARVAENGPHLASTGPRQTGLQARPAAGHEGNSTFSSFFFTFPSGTVVGPASEGPGGASFRPGTEF